MSEGSPIPRGRTWRWSPEVLCLFLLCLLDTLTSAYLFHLQVAVEWNPLLRPYAEAGPVPFLVAKSLTFVPCVLFMEWYRHHRPRFVALLVRTACVGYVGIYISLSALQMLRHP